MTPTHNPVWNNCNGGSCQCGGSCQGASQQSILETLHDKVDAAVDKIKSHLSATKGDTEVKGSPSSSSGTITTTSDAGCTSCKQMANRKKYLLAAGVVLVIGVTAIIVS